MDKGKSIALGTKEELKKMIKTGEKLTVEILELSAEHKENIEKLPHVYQVEYEDNRLAIYFNGGKRNLVRVLEYLGENEIPFGRVFSELPTLNDVFLEITGKQLRD